jgi:phosphatidylethanolamine/phosphatidyl-N-methylethanolamine N-methyltransferase
MSNQLSDRRLFWREFRTHFHTTGAVLPSGRRLAAALAHFVGDSQNLAPRTILEVGPGTGAVTAQIVAALRPCDRLDLVELNGSFVDRLRDRFQNDAAFQPAAARARVLHCSVAELPGDVHYDVIVSGLPLNNFAVADVRQLLDVLTGLLLPGGTLSFFEYIALRGLKTLVSSGNERARLGGIAQLLRELLSQHEIRRDWIWANVPPAWVHHLRVSSCRFASER